MPHIYIQTLADIKAHAAGLLPRAKALGNYCILSLVLCMQLCPHIGHILNTNYLLRMQFRPCSKIQERNEYNYYIKLPCKPVAAIFKREYSSNNQNNAGNFSGGQVLCTELEIEDIKSTWTSTVKWEILHHIRKAFHLRFTYSKAYHILPMGISTQADKRDCETAMI